MAAKIPVDLIDACLTALTTTYAATSKLHWFTNNPTLSKANVVGDFVEAGSTGLQGGKTIATWSVPYNNPLTGLETVAGADAVGIASGGIPVGGETINGWYLLDSMGMDLEAAEYLSTPVAIALVGDGLVTTPTVDQSAFC